MQSYTLIVLGLPRPVRILLTLLHVLVVTFALSAILDWMIQIIAGVALNPSIYLDYVFDLPPSQQIALVILFTFIALVDYVYGWMYFVGIIGESMPITRRHTFYLQLGLLCFVLTLAWIISNILLRVL